MSQKPDTPTAGSRRGTGYYAERLLSQAIASPEVNALGADEVREYVETMAARLSLDEQEVADKAMRGYETVTTGDFKTATEYRVFERHS